MKQGAGDSRWPRVKDRNKDLGSVKATKAFGFLNCK